MGEKLKEKRKKEGKIERERNKDELIINQIKETSNWKVSNLINQ